MSILLESLQQKDNQADASVPNLGDSHYDDDMLSDEWLLAKVKHWQQISLLLVLVLATSWSYFLLSEKVPENSQSKIEKTISSDINHNHSNQNKASKLDSQADLTTENPPATEKKSSQSKALELNRVNYKPQKIESNPTAIKQQNSAQQKLQVAVKHSLSESKIAANQTDELPELKISSYAISSNPKKSVVVINGRFYSQGDTIAPTVKLIAIKKDGILIEQNSMLELIKYP